MQIFTLKHYALNTKFLILFVAASLKNIFLKSDLGDFLCSINILQNVPKNPQKI